MPNTRGLARILGVGMTPLNQAKGVNHSAVQLMVQAVNKALADAEVEKSCVDGLIAMPSLMSDRHFMIGHAVASEAGLLPKPTMVVKTLDVGGAGPVSALLIASRMVQHEGHHAVAVVCGDTVASAPTEEFLARANSACRPLSDPCNGGEAAADEVPSPVIPHLYDRVAQWQMEQFGVTREQLAMVASLMTYQASHHPDALHKRPRPVEEVLASPSVAPVTTRLECAKLADGGAAALVVSEQFMQERGLPREAGVVVLGGGKGSGLLCPGPPFQESMFSAATTVNKAYKAAGVCVHDIDFFGLYDCFPVCFIRALEAVHLAPTGQGGALVERWYRQLFGSTSSSSKTQAAAPSSSSDAAAAGAGGGGGGGGGGSSGPPKRPFAAAPGGAAWSGPRMPFAASPPPFKQEGGTVKQVKRRVLPVNTHGGLLGFGAPWEVPAMYSVIEAVRQLRGEAEDRQVMGARRALVYGNGGIFSSSAVVILEKQSALPKL